jgi:hypothetical protein
MGEKNGYEKHIRDLCVGDVTEKQEKIFSSNCSGSDSAQWLFLTDIG